MSETYTVHMRDVTFELTRDQVNFDSPNYFTSRFFSDSTESRTRTLVLFRDPELFRIVLDHLTGYQVLPLHEFVVPKRMNPETVLGNLLADAQFYELNSLVDKINRKLEEPRFVSLFPQSLYVLLTECRGVDMEPVWSPITFVSEETARQTRDKYGISDAVSFSWLGTHKILEILDEARLPTSYLVEATWNRYIDDSCFVTFLLRLVGQ